MRYPPPNIAISHNIDSANATLEDGRSPSQAIATRKFHLLWLRLFVNGITGIFNAIVILEDLTQSSAVSSALLFGLMSIFKVGRVFWGAISAAITRLPRWTGAVHQWHISRRHADGHEPTLADVQSMAPKLRGQTRPASVG